MLALLLTIVLLFTPAFADQLEQESDDGDEEKLTLEDAEEAALKGVFVPKLIESSWATPSASKLPPKPDPESRVAWREYVTSGEVVAYETRYHGFVAMDCYELASGERVETAASLNRVPVGETVFVYREQFFAPYSRMWAYPAEVKAYDRLMPTKEKPAWW
jgi:hypothetical protein